jgi:hypothetical protein
MEEPVSNIVPEKPKSNIETIDMGYAVIHIDHDAEAFDNEGNYNYPDPLVNKYYSDTRSNLHWNYYYLVPSEKLQEKIGNTPIRPIQEKLMLDDAYARKYSLNALNIPKFIRHMFPPLTENHGQVALFKNIHYRDTKNLALKKIKEDERFKDFKPLSSFMREFSSMKTLYELDCLRRDLINKPHLKVFFYTHSRHELNLAKHKLDCLNAIIV